MKVFKIITVLPISISLAIYFSMKHFKQEYFNNDIVDYEMRKFNNDNSTGMELIFDEIEFFISNNKTHVHILNIIIWITIVYVFSN